MSFANGNHEMYFKWPLKFQERFSVGVFNKDRSRRVERLTAATPTTFTLNWDDYCENGSPDPVTCPNAVAFMGPAISARAGKGYGSPRKSAAALLTVVKAFVEAGLKVDVVRDETSTTEATSENETFDSSDYMKLRFTRSGARDVLAVVTTGCGWTYIRCSKALSSVVVDKLHHDFAFGCIENNESIVYRSNDFTIVQMTGSPRDCRNGMTTTTNTLFRLEKGGKIISKALLSYKNNEMDNPGPTIELFETAIEWQGRGYGTLLFDNMEIFYTSVFHRALVYSRVMFNVCHVSSLEGTKFFQDNCGFRDLDGMGEELGKYLRLTDEDDSIEEDDYLEEDDDDDEEDDDEEKDDDEEDDEEDDDEEDDDDDQDDDSWPEY